MESLVSWLLTAFMAAPIANTAVAVGLLLGFIGTWWGYVSSRKPRPSYRIDTWALADNKKSKFGEVKFIWRDRELPRVSATKVYIWNAGRAAIHGTAISSEEPLRIS